MKPLLLALLAALSLALAGCATPEETGDDDGDRTTTTEGGGGQVSGTLEAVEGEGNETGSENETNQTTG